ncbi:hypothetical protein NYR54_01700 [Chelativorans sp. SCAU2101]|jgi:hypothetical protein|uniref:Uncharacterized protein n=1 Tax=Chelativorans petroleitrophicus TaxID=2975484 RepID=A0A9X2X7C4_9HYPH|nr:hypothetical protein [Chelativorans petroleitrophicus]MCT8989010.1 hypothetical protein [Chelativorans petroleitrophicus]
MANRPAPFTQADVTRAIKGALAAGVQVREVIATAEGVRIILTGNDNARKGDDWDDIRNAAP